MLSQVLPCLYSDGVTQFLSTMGNFPSLLNQAEQVRNHGRFRWYWDGMRERYIKSVKKILKNLCKSPSYFTKKKRNDVEVIGGELTEGYFTGFGRR